MDGLTGQDGSLPMPHGTFQLLEIDTQAGSRLLRVPYADAPPYFVAVSAAIPRSNGYLPSELTQLLGSVRQETGLRYCRLIPLCDANAQESRIESANAERTIVWLGAAADDSDVAMRSLARMHERMHAISLGRLWSRREGQALLALAERSIWRDLSPDLLAETYNLWLYCGQSGISWDAVLHFRGLLAELAVQGRMEHHQFAHAILGSQASHVIGVTAGIQEQAFAVKSEEYPPALPYVSNQPDSGDALAGYSSQLDQSISAVETRWMMLNQGVHPHVAPDTLAEMDLDAEIARYTQLLQQIDVLETDLESLDGLTNHIRCLQYDARTPRSSPEIAP